MATKVLAPLLGEGVTELTILRWLKKEGEPVQEFESLLEVETDKVVTEIPSPASGIMLKVLASENEQVNVGKVLAWVGQPGEKVDGEGAANSSPVLSQTSEKVPTRKAGQEAALPPTPAERSAGFISPLVSRIARENNIDLAQVRGTGLGRRITKKDVIDFLQGGGKAAAVLVTTTPSPGDQVVPHSSIRKSIAEHMLLSKQTSPHVLTVLEADLTRVMTHRNANMEDFEREGIHLTYTPYFIYALVAALRENPHVNSSWTEAGIVLHASINIGMATSLGEEGLIVPVIKQADRLSLSGLARTVNDLAERARTKRLRPEEVREGTFTITNHGVSGSLFAMPIINQPQCGILGVGVIQKRPIVITAIDGSDSIAIRLMAYLSFVFDHRILDGALADKFLSKVVESLENWH